MTAAMVKEIIRKTGMMILNNMNTTLIPEKTETKIIVTAPKKLVVEFDNVDEAGHIASILGKTAGTVHDGLFCALVEYVGEDNYDAKYLDKYEGRLRKVK